MEMKCPWCSNDDESLIDSLGYVVPRDYHIYVCNNCSKVFYQNSQGEYVKIESRPQVERT